MCMLVSLRIVNLTIKIFSLTKSPVAVIDFGGRELVTVVGSTAFRGRNSNGLLTESLVPPEWKGNSPVRSKSYAKDTF